MFQALCTSMNDYDRFSPTKQNFLCNRQSALETILNHEDFNLNPHNIGNKSVQLGIQLTPPMFNYGFQKSSLSLILVLDISQQMQAHWVRTRDALFRLVSHIPTGILERKNIFYCCIILIITRSKSFVTSKIEINNSISKCVLIYNLIMFFF